MKLKTSIFALCLSLCVLNAQAQIAEFENLQVENQPTTVTTNEINVEEDIHDDAPRISIVGGTSHAFFAPSHVFSPDPRRAWIYSAIFPGLGQTYNRQFWKLPILYGAAAGFVYAISWNQGHFRDAQGAFVDLVSGDPTATRWHYFVPPGMTPEQFLELRGADWFAGVLERRRDFYRHWRDLSIILTVGLYFLAMVDAYVDARLFSFTMSQDLSMRIAPAMITQKNNSQNSTLLNSAYGLQWSFRF